MIINFNFSTFDVRLLSPSQDTIRLSGLGSAAETRAHLILHCQREFPKNSSLQSKVVLDTNRLCNNSVQVVLKNGCLPWMDSWKIVDSRILKKMNVFYS